MSPIIRHPLRSIVAAAAMATLMTTQTVSAQTIIDEWASVKVPPAPVLKAVTADSKTTALLMLDFNAQTCNQQRRPRCIASLPKVAKMLAAARAAGVMVVYSLGGGGKVTDIHKEVAPIGGEPVVSSGVDKFRGTDLEEILKSKGIKTVVVAGAAAHGAILYTASGAAMRGMKVLVPVDAISADLAYAEQYTVWQLANAPLVGSAVTLTSIDALKFQ